MTIKNKKEIFTGIRVVKNKYKGKYPLGVREPRDNDTDKEYKIRIAYEWLDAQRTIAESVPRYDLKDMISDWGGKYISVFYIIVAASLHDDIECDYPSINIGANVIRPRQSRLDSINNLEGERWRELRAKEKKQEQERKPYVME